MYGLAKHACCPWVLTFPCADVTGPSNAAQAVLAVYDIFGFFPQTIQGADILAHSDKEHPYQVFVPDFFDGEPADISWYPPDTKEKGEKLGNFFQTKAGPPLHLPKIKDIVKEASESNSNLSSWGIIGYCWGGKMTSLVAGQQTKFKAAVQCHPAMLDPSDAEKVQIPMCVLASKDENADDVKNYEANLKVTKHVETFSDQIHGWMAARADLDDPIVLKEYERGYKIALTFFHDNL
jgi:dienelactone hydrolase